MKSQRYNVIMRNPCFTQRNHSYETSRAIPLLHLFHSQYSNITKSMNGHSYETYRRDELNIVICVESFFERFDENRPH